MKKKLKTEGHPVSWLVMNNLQLTRRKYGEIYKESTLEKQNFEWQIQCYGEKRRWIIHLATSWWHIKRDEQDAHSPKFEKIGLFRHPKW